MTAAKPSPRKRTPRTNPELAVRRAELPPVPEVVEPVQEPTTAHVVMPLLPARADDPPIYREVWNQHFGLPAAH